ncbi:MAG TPA: TonB-dependent receptor [Noviherbaspirillum sp.]|uniref:TonB-dependent receptor family protein n=1 Tax=Noviherbaspirillum sp. TaxID=1926288 RepID=UPI002F9219A6
MSAATASVCALPVLMLLAASIHAQESVLPAVTVTAPTPGQQTRQEIAAEQARTPGGVTLVDSDALFQRTTTNIADVLRDVPGAWATSSSGSDAAFLSIRGSNLDAVDYDNNGVKLLQDGLPVTAADGNNHNRFIDPLSARHVIVARGANALTYGASTLGGAIDFITPTALDAPPLEMFFNAGSHGLVQSRFTAGKVAEHLDGLVTIEAKRRDGYREHNKQNREGLYANAGWRFSDAVQTRVYLSYVDNDEQLPGPLTRAQWRDDPDQAEAAAVAGNYQWNVKTWRLANKTTWTIDADSSVSFGVSYEEQDLYHPIVQSPFFSLLIDTEQRNAGTTLRYHRRMGSHDVLAGVNYGRTWVEGGNFGNDGGRRTSLATRVDNNADNLELFLMDRWQFAPRLTAVYGAQAVSGSREVRNVAASSGAVTHPKDDYDSLNPRAGLIYDLTPKAQLFTNVSRVYEAPTTYQLEDRPGGAPLGAMRGIVYEVGTRGTHAVGKTQWRWDLAAYYTKLRDEILSVEDPAAPGTAISGNVDRTVHAGIEALVGASFAVDGSGSHRIEPLLNLTFNHFRFDNDRDYGNNRLPAAPRHALRGELLYRHASGFFAGPTFDVVGRRYADFSNTYKIASYTLWGLRAGMVRKDWELFGEIRNLGDRNYIARHSVRSVASAGDAILSPGEPRSMYVGIRTRF